MIRQQMHQISAYLPTQSHNRSQLYGKSFYLPNNSGLCLFVAGLFVCLLLTQLLCGCSLISILYTSAALDTPLQPSILSGSVVNFLFSLHTTITSALFIIIFAYLGHGLLYGSYRDAYKPVWLTAICVLICLLIGSFFDAILFDSMIVEGGLYGKDLSVDTMQIASASHTTEISTSTSDLILPSTSTTASILSYLSAIPMIGESVFHCLQAQHPVAIRRLFVVDMVLMPSILCVLTIMHLSISRRVGVNNTDGIDIYRLQNKGVPLDGINIRDYLTPNKLLTLSLCWLASMATLVMSMFILSRWASTNLTITYLPQIVSQIALFWSRPFDAIFYSMSSGVFGYIAMLTAILMPCLLPWLDKSPVKSIRYKGVASKIATVIFLLNFLLLGCIGGMIDLGWLSITGTQGHTTITTSVIYFCTFLYFLFFLMMPVYTALETCKRPPTRLT